MLGTTPRCLQPLSQLTQFSEELELQALPKQACSDVHQQSCCAAAVTDHLILLTEAVIDISMNLYNSICTNSVFLTTYAAFPRYKHIWPVGSHCVWLYSVKPQLALSTHFPVTKPVVISRCDCTIGAVHAAALSTVTAAQRCFVNSHSRTAKHCKPQQHHSNTTNSLKPQQCDTNMAPQQNTLAA